MRFNKSHKTVDEQIELLRSRGMVIDDQDTARHYLSHLNYYRLSGYWLPFESDHQNHIFRDGTHFKNVLNLYIFDRELRLLVLDAIERIEISLRTQWVYWMAEDYGPHGYLDHQLSQNPRWFQKNLDDLKSEISRSKEVFIEHYQNQYSDPELPPIWAVCEVMSLGLLSRWYKNLRPMSTRSKIAGTYNLDNMILQSFIHHLTEIRNICAHHSRLWNRKFTVIFQLPRNPLELSKILINKKLVVFIIR